MPVSAFLSGCLLVLPCIGGHPHEFVVVVQHNRLWYVAVRRLPGQSRQKQLPSTPGHDCALEINIVDTVLWPQPHNQPRDRCGDGVGASSPAITRTCTCCFRDVSLVTRQSCCCSAPAETSKVPSYPRDATR